MVTECLLDLFDREMRCEYKGRVYMVRDNGAICRLHKLGCPAGKWDDVWTFGKKDLTNGYMIFSGHRVHQIVCTAFHGAPPYPNMVVDHIDTNRCNNRPENLRWLTRLENALKNPITRARIENICGSIEVFLADPSVLRGHKSKDPNFKWMRTVTPDEAHISLERLTAWAKAPTKPQGGSLGEWIFWERRVNTETRYNTSSFPNIRENEMVTPLENEIEEREPLRTQSLTPNAVQLNWKNPMNFPCCPQEFSGNPLEAYLANLEEGKVFCTNEYGDSTVLRFGMPQHGCLWIMCRISLGFKTHAFTMITFKDGIFYHRNKGVYDIGDEPDKIFDMIMDEEVE